MHQYFATVEWQRNDQIFYDNQYSRAHEWQFDGGLTVAASSSPLSVPLPMSAAENVDPEEALIAALSSCHMLFFLSFACKRGWIVERYQDQAVGIMEKNEVGKMAITRITLRPQTAFSGESSPNKEQLHELHHLAHEHCYIANSIRANVTVEIT